MAQSQVHPTDNGQTPPWGARLREARQARQMSLRELSRRLNVSPGHLSQVERDIVAPSISLLYAITAELHISLDSLFSADSRPELPSAPPEGAAAAPRTAGESRYVLRAGERQVIEASPGVRWELLTPSTDTPIDFREIVYASTESPDKEAFIRHEGVEFGLVLEGRLHVQIEFDTYVLDVGDTITFESSRPHRFWNEGPGVARAAWVSNVSR